MEKQRLQDTMKGYQKRYLNILNNIWPTIGSNGFAEHNQTVNFINAYCEIADQKDETVSTWYEFQIPSTDKNDNRIDGVILNHTTKEMFLIEAKRFSKNNLSAKKEELAEDFYRIMRLDFVKRFNEFAEYQAPKLKLKQRRSLQ